MIIVRITSGLGNQMYQYNFYRMMKEMYPSVSVKADITWFNASNEHHGFELNKIFANVPGSDFSLDVASSKEIYKVTGQIPNLVKGPLAGTCRFLLGPVNRILRERIHPNREYYSIDRLESERTDSFYEDVTHLDTSKDWYLFGFWIEEEYYKNRLDKIRSQFIFPALPEGENQRLAERMRDSESVCIHVRRGDYLSATYSDKFLTLGKEYYRKAVDYIRTVTSNPKFFIFSDDEEFVKNEFTWLSDKTIVTCNTGNSSYRDMQLMSLCKHSIIANSTFSQWGALLDVNEGHITVYPAAYMKGEDSEQKSLAGWVRI